MDTVGIGSRPSVLPAIPQAPSAPSGDAILAKPVQQTPAVEVKTETFDTKAIEKQRLARVEKAAVDIANIYVVSNQVFTIFKDATGQYVTRFRNLQTGKITYIPEPELLKKSSDATSLLNTLA